MRTPFIAVFLTLFTAATVPAAEKAVAIGGPHVRALTDSARTLVADAAKRSDIVASLMRELDASDVIVFVGDAMTNDSGEPAASLRFISCAGGVRYLLIKVDRWLAAPWVRIAGLGHELQHAVEVARAPEVRDGKGLARLYRRIGWEGQSGRFESHEAQATGTRVLYQLLASPRQ